MHHRPHPWKWPAVIVVALVLLFGGVFFTPRSWILFFFSPLSLELVERRAAPRGWLEILPPPRVQIAEVEAEPESERPEPEEPVEWENPDWWREGWRVKTEAETVRELRAAPIDSVAVLLIELGIGQEFFDMVKPDSVLAARLHLLQVEDSYRFDELKPYLSAMTRARAHRDIKSRVADMYDDFLSTDIMVPD
jgi:hypothetical protein